MDNQPPVKYKEVDPRDAVVSNPRIIEIYKGDRLPPTQEKDENGKSNDI